MAFSFSNPYSGSAFIPGPGAKWVKTKYYLDVGYSQPTGDALLKVKFYRNHEDRKENNYCSSAINSSYAAGTVKTTDMAGRQAAAPFDPERIVC